MITSEEALRAFLEKTGLARERVSASIFGRVYDDTVDSLLGPSRFAHALQNMIEWYEEERATPEPDKLSPLRVVEAYRLARVWVIFLARERAQ